MITKRLDVQVFKPIIVQLTFETKEEIDNLIGDLRESYSDDVQFTELDSLVDILNDIK